MPARASSRNGGGSGGGGRASSSSSSSSSSRIFARSAAAELTRDPLARRRASLFPAPAPPPPRSLYAEGKVCLSLLGTWAGPGWVPGVSTLGQVLMSIQVRARRGRAGGRAGGRVGGRRARAQQQRVAGPQG